MRFFMNDRDRVIWDHIEIESPILPIQIEVKTIFSHGGMCGLMDGLVGLLSFLLLPFYSSSSLH